MSNGQGQAQRLGEVFARMGFTQSPGFPTEWVLKDSETNSEMYLSLVDFEYDEGSDLGFWWLSSSAFFVSPAGGRLGDVRADVEVAVLTARAESAERRCAELEAARDQLCDAIIGEGLPGEARSLSTEDAIAHLEQSRRDERELYEEADSDREACARLVEAARQFDEAAGETRTTARLMLMWDAWQEVKEALAAIPEETRQRLAEMRKP